MWSDLPADVFRSFNVVLGAACLAVMAWRACTAPRPPRAGMMHHLAVAAMVTALTLSSLEALLAAYTSPGIRVYLITLALAWMLAALILERKDTK